MTTYRTNLAEASRLSIYCWVSFGATFKIAQHGGDGGGRHWLVRMEWRPAGWSVCLPLLIFPCTIKSRSSDTGSPGWSRKKGHKTVLVVVLKLFNIGQGYGEKWTASSALYTGALSCWKMKNWLKIWHMADRNCCNRIKLWVIPFTKLDCVIDKCQTGVVSTTSDSSTDAISD